MLCHPKVTAEPDALSEAMSGLAAVSRNIDLDQLEDEYHALFIGIGKGEVVPYGSWYLTGFLMEQPLSDLRDDLRAGSASSAVRKFTNQKTT